MTSQLLELINAWRFPKDVTLFHASCQRTTRLELISPGISSRLFVLNLDSSVCETIFGWLLRHKSLPSIKSLNLHVVPTMTIKLVKRACAARPSLKCFHIVSTEIFLLNARFVVDAPPEFSYYGTIPIRRHICELRVQKVPRSDRLGRRSDPNLTFLEVHHQSNIICLPFLFPF